MYFSSLQPFRREALVIDWAGLHSTKGLRVPTAEPMTRQKAALIVAHPGHELCIYRWLELAKPVVFVLTDGSGRTGHSRLDSTSAVLSSAGARPGLVYGCFTDAQLYGALLAGDVSVFARTLRAIAGALVEAGVDYVVGDAIEGFSPSHDICRFLTNAVVSLLHNERGSELGNFDFLLDGCPGICEERLREAAIRVRLDDDDLRRKLAAADAYPELRGETARALERFGPEAFRTEYLRPVVDRTEGLEGLEHEPPAYERYGEQRVGNGHYGKVIRYRSHVRPLVKELWRETGLAPASA
jgi:hypothetical protein